MWKEVNECCDDKKKITLFRIEKNFYILRTKKVTTSINSTKYQRR